MSSGVKVNQQCLEAFQNLKLKKQYKYIIYRLSPDHTEIVVEKTSDSDDYDEFLANLPPTECRYAIKDLEYEKEGEGKRNKICFYTWSPDDSKIKEKMVYASSKAVLRKSLVGVAAEIQATDASEAAQETVLEKVSRNTY